MGYLDKDGNYYEGDRQYGDSEYPSPPLPAFDYEPNELGGWKERIKPVPLAVTPLQARLALRQAGLLDAVNSAASPGTEAELAWFFANSIERNSTFVKSLAVILGLTDPQIDALFISASGFS